MDDPASLSLRLTLIAVLLAVSGFFSSSETAVFSLTKLQVQRLRDESSALNQIILRFVDNPRRLLITSLLGNTFVNTAFATLVTSLALVLGMQVMGWSEATALMAATGSGTVLLLLFGEICPKTFALRRADRVARLVVIPLWAASWVLAPLRYLIRTLVDLTLRVLGIGGSVTSAAVTEDEIRESVTTGEESGIIQRDERRLIDRVFHLREMLAKDIMVPRTDMICVDIDLTVTQAFETAEGVGHSRIPVYQDRVDNVVGILHVKDVPRWRDNAVRDARLRDLVAAPGDGSSADTASLLRPPLLLPETKRVDALLRDFSAEGTYMAILLDEYGGTAGLITVEDIIEEIVGEIVDEYDELTEPILEEDFTDELLSTEGVQLPAKLSLRTASRVLRTPLDTDVADTIGGYVYSLVGRIPSVGESVVNERGIVFDVTAMTGSRIQRVLVRVPDLEDRDLDNAEAVE